MREVEEVRRGEGGGGGGSTDTIKGELCQIVQHQLLFYQPEDPEHQSTCRALYFSPAASSMSDTHYSAVSVSVVLLPVHLDL